MKTRFFYCLSFFLLFTANFSVALASEIKTPEQEVAVTLVEKEGIPSGDRFTDCEPLFDLGRYNSFIHRCFDSKLKKIVIIKYVQQDNKKFLLNEYGVFQSTINLRYTIKMLGFIKEGEKIYLIIEYANGGDLSAIPPKHSKYALKYFLAAMKSIKELHENRIAHRDIKPGNFFIVRDEKKKLSLRIGDFDVAQYLPAGCRSLTRRGTIPYMAPEVFNIGKSKAGTYDPFKSDIFSAGVLYFTLITNELLFEMPSDEDPWFLTLKKKGFVGYLKKYYPDQEFGKKPVYLLGKMLDLDPEKRPTAKEVYRFLEEELEKKELKKKALKH